jgi:hypothetical protein
MSYPFGAIAPARPPAISDRELDQLTRIAHDARNELCSQAEAEWLISASGPLLEELRRYRAVSARNTGLAETVNIIQLPIAR